MDLPFQLKSPRKGLINIKKKIKNVFYGVMLGILIPQKNTQKEIEKWIKNLFSILLIQKKLQRKIKRLLVILIMTELNFPCKKKILERLSWKAIYALTCLVMNMSWFFQFMFQLKNLKTQWICCFKLMMMINHIMCTSKILTDLCFTKQKIKTKNGFVKVVYSVLVARMCG